MSERVVDSFEEIEVDKHHRQLLGISRGEGNGLGATVLQKRAIREDSQKGVLRRVGKLQGLLSHGAQVVQDRHRSGDVPFPVADVPRAILYVQLDAVTP